MTLTANLGITHLEGGQAQPHVVINDAFTNFDKAIAGRTAVDCSAGGTIALTGGQTTAMFLNPYGTVAANFTLTVQNTNKMWVVINDTNRDLTIKTVAGVGVVVKAGYHTVVYCDSANCHYALGYQRASSAQAAVSGTAGASYTATEQGLINNLVTLTNELRTALVNLQLIKGSA
jgi:hypothetical protein